MSRKSIFVLFLIIFYFANISVNAVGEVIATGQARIINNNVSQARDEALQDAFLDTVRKTIGTYISKQTIMENQEVLKSKIYSKAEGYVTEYEILQEYAKDGLYTVKIMAKATNKLWDNLERLGFILRTQAGHPRCLLLINSNIDEQERFSIFDSRLRSKLSNSGFILIDNEAIKNIINMTEFQRGNNDNNQSIISLGDTYGADIVIYGNVFTEATSKQQLSSSTLNVITAYSDLKAFTTGDGHMIASIYSTENAYSESKSVAENLALEKVSISGGEKLIRKIIASLNKSIAQRSIKLEVKNVKDYSVLSSFENILLKIRGIKRVYLRNYSNGIASYDLLVNQEPNIIAFKLNEEYNINVLEVVANRIKIKLN